jgi:hypothetical protein
MEPFYVVEIVASAVFYGLSFLLFSFTRPWRTLPGLVLLTVLFCLATVLGVVATSYLLGDYEARPMVRAIIYTLTLLGSMLVFISVLVGQINGSKERKRRQNDDRSGSVRA